VGRGDGTDSQPDEHFNFPVILVEHSSDQSQSFIEKLWAVRRIGEILDQIDLTGQNDELVKELVTLSLKHGIMTPYTSFLADENSRSDLSTETKAAGDRLKEFDRYADGQQGVEQRAAKHVLQQMNQPAAASPIALGKSLAGGVSGSIVDVSSAPGAASAHQVPGIEAKQFYGAVAASKDDETKVVQNIRQIGRKAFFCRGESWIDSAVTPDLEKNIVKVKRFSPDYFQLIDKHGTDVVKYLSIDEPLTLELDGQAYEIP
jgi:Ca-activated chloride channel homolog